MALRNTAPLYPNPNPDPPKNHPDTSDLTPPPFLPAPYKYKKRGLRRLTRVHVKWCIWYANESKPSKEDQVHALQIFNDEYRDKALPPVVCTYDMVRVIKRDPKAQEFIRRYHENGLESAKQVFLDDLSYYVELHRWGAEKAREKEALNMIPQYTQPALRAIMPEQAPQPPVQVVLKLSPARADLLTAERPVIEAEAIVIEDANERSHG